MIAEIIIIIILIFAYICSCGIRNNDAVKPYAGGRQMTSYMKYYINEYLPTIDEIHVTDDIENIPFPFKRFFVKETAPQIFARLHAARTDDYLTTCDDMPKSIPIQFFPEFLRSNLRFGDKYHILYFKWPQDYYDITILSDLFIEPIRVTANVKDYPNPRDYWKKYKDNIIRILNEPSDSSQVSIFLQNATKLAQNAPNVTANTVYQAREQIYTSCRETSQFKPILAKHLYTTAQNALIDAGIIADPSEYRILDTSSGWGDRLLAGLSIDPGEYVGIDPNKKLQPGYNAMIKMAEKYYDHSVNAQVIPIGAEHIDTVKYKNHFHCCLTAPPFFDFEVYAHDKAQSIAQFNTEEKWVNGFVFPMMKNVYKVLKCGGYFILYMCNNRQFHALESVIKKAIKIGFIYKGVIFAQEATATPKPSWIFTKA